MKGLGRREASTAPQLSSWTYGGRAVAYPMPVTLTSPITKIKSRSSPPGPSAAFMTERVSVVVNGRDVQHSWQMVRRTVLRVHRRSQPPLQLPTRAWRSWTCSTEAEVQALDAVLQLLEAARGASEAGHPVSGPTPPQMSRDATFPGAPRKPSSVRTARQITPIAHENRAERVPLSSTGHGQLPMPGTTTSPAPGRSEAFVIETAGLFLM